MLCSVPRCLKEEMNHLTAHLNNHMGTCMFNKCNTDPPAVTQEALPSWLCLMTKELWMTAGMAPKQGAAMPATTITLWVSSNTVLDTATSWKPHCSHSRCGKAKKKRECNTNPHWHSITYLSIAEIKSCRHWSSCLRGKSCLMLQFFPFFFKSSFKIGRILLQSMKSSYPRV